jgi:Cys-tRNA(Pro) deacylase
MLTSPDFPGRFLIEVSDLAAEPPPEAIRGDLELLRRIVGWAERYLCQPHPQLGRSGPVCPYVQASMRRCAFLLAVCPSAGLDAGGLERTLLDYRDWFLRIEPREGNGAAFKTILILFPDLDRADVPRLIDRTQDRLKGEYVARGLMIGEFHDGPPDKAGLWNEDFRPLASPIPMLVIRHMVATDFPFLKRDRSFVLSYLSQFRGQIPPHLREEVIRVAFGFGIPLPTAEEMAAVHPQVAAALEASGAPFVVHRHRDLPQPQNGPQDFARALGYDLGRITKSLFLRCRCHGQYAIAVCPVDRKVNLQLLARHLGCKRLELATMQEAVALVGYAPGGISPIGTQGIPVLMDEQLFAFPTVVSAAGEVAVEIEIDPARLREMTGAQVLAFAAEAGPGSSPVIGSLAGEP